MDIRISVDQTLEDSRHVHRLMAGRTGIYRYASPATLLLLMFLLAVTMAGSFLDGITAYEFLLFFFLFAMLLMAVAVQFVVVPRRIKKAFLQFKDFAGAQEYLFTDDGVTVKDQRGESTIPWGKYVKWVEDDTVLLLFQTDNLLNFIPKRCLAGEQMDDIRRAITAAGIPVHKISHVGTILWMALVVFIMAPVVCITAALMLYSFLQTLAGN
jgi:hypothetical protein